MSVDYYAILTVSRGASHEDIVRAYQEKAKPYHPDRNPGFVEEANRRLQELNAAYEALRDLGSSNEAVSDNGQRPPTEPRRNARVEGHRSSAAHEAAPRVRDVASDLRALADDDLSSDTTRKYRKFFKENVVNRLAPRLVDLGVDGHFVNLAVMSLHRTANFALVADECFFQVAVDGW
jgi:curved DNA-binding protein CbpA